MKYGIFISDKMGTRVGKSLIFGNWNQWDAGYLDNN